MKFKELFITFTLAGLVIFSLFSFYFGLGEYYNYNEENLTVRNISLEEYKENLQEVEKDAQKLESIFKSESIIITTFNLIVKGIPASVKIIYRGTIGNMNLIFRSSKAIFAIPILIISVIAGIIIIILILAGWDLIRGTTKS